MKTMKYVLFLLIFCVLSLTLVKAQKETSCEIAAFVANPASGVNVRNGAGLNHKIAQTIPRDSDGTLVFIDGAKGDWLKISSAVNFKKKKVFSGVGWVHAPLLAVKIGRKNDELIDYYETPNSRREERGSLRSGFVLNLLGCSGNWIKASIPMRGTEKEIAGWFPHGFYCGSPWEDCM